MIHVKCPNCDKQLGIGDEHAGSLGMCPDCAVTFLIPGPAVLLFDIPTAVPIRVPEPGEPPVIVSPPPQPTPPPQPMPAPSVVASDWSMVSLGPATAPPAPAPEPVAEKTPEAIPVATPAPVPAPAPIPSLELSDSEFPALDGPAPVVTEDLLIPMPEDSAAHGEPAQAIPLPSLDLHLELTPGSPLDLPLGFAESPPEEALVLALPVTGNDLRPVAPEEPVPALPVGWTGTAGREWCGDRALEGTGSELVPREEAPAEAVPVVVLPIPEESTPYTVLPPVEHNAASLAVPVATLAESKRPRYYDDTDAGADPDQGRFSDVPRRKRRGKYEGMVSLIPGVDDRNLALVVLGVIWALMILLAVAVPWLGWVTILVGAFLYAMGLAWFRQEQRDAGFFWQVAFAFVPFLSVFFVLGSREKSLRPFLVLMAGILLIVAGGFAMWHHFENLDRGPPPAGPGFINDGL
jgi:hypothetical protein